MAPCNASGVPLGDGAGNLPLLGLAVGDLTDNVRILWRGLSFCTGGIATSGVTRDFANDWMGYVPLEHVKAKAFMKEGQGLFWVTEVVTGTSDLITHSADVTMSLALKTRW